jgi:queuosine precursor transporter
MLQAVIVSAWYIAAQMLADITSLKIISFAGLSMDAGTLVYPITFTLRDLVHKAAGIRVARWLIVTAAIINLFMALLFWVVSRLPGDPNVGAQTAFAEVLSPVWRIVIASIIAEVISELVDTEAYRIWIEHITQRYQWMRVLASNSLSVPLDSLIFSWAAFGGVLSNPVVWSIFLSNVLVKGVTTLISLPLIYLVRDRNSP